ncbi:hypothetical protein GCM10012275_44520 [Longimycelium tulufanense]|uniref:Lipid droplet-associated protein n=1 Tax=Longimycelium tulufanense TaxID=907463 RepID=A0A8J3FW55_9PSEU|nr:lipid droplet-associated protein [Longimycelium tulufanense]GGM69200.1 hypothetical protein GCM10012275_44520 [Longimycelium tulufanense]
MKPLPLPVRVAAGLAVTAVEEARKLPRQLAGLPVTVASQALQLSMRVQQQITELAIKGDEALAGLRPAEEQPEWATFDEDLETAPARPGRAEPGLPEEEPTWRSEEPGLDEGMLDIELADEAEAPARGAAVPQEPPLADYDGMTLAQVRARLRKLSVDDLAALLAWERGHADRPQFSSMLANRLAKVRAEGSQ